jgi:hypothetical protein
VRDGFQNPQIFHQPLRFSPERSTLEGKYLCSAKLPDIIIHTYIHIITNNYLSKCVIYLAFFSRYNTFYTLLAHFFRGGQFSTMKRDDMTAKNIKFPEYSNVGLCCRGQTYPIISYPISRQKRIGYYILYHKHHPNHPPKQPPLLPGRRCESNEMVLKIGFGHLLEYPYFSGDINKTEKASSHKPRIFP